LSGKRQESTFKKKPISVISGKLSETLSRVVRSKRKKNIIANICLQDMTSFQNSDLVSPKTATLMVALDKLTLQMNQMQQHNQQQFERLQKSNEDVSMRLEGMERRRKRHDDSDHSSHNDEAKHVVRPQRGQRREVFGNHMLRRDNNEEEHGFRPRQGQR